MTGAGATDEATAAATAAAAAAAAAAAGSDLRSATLAVHASPDLAVPCAELLVGHTSRHDRVLVRSLAAGSLADATAAAVAGGWSPADLGQIVRRRLTAEHVAGLVALLATETRRHPPDRVATGWADELADLGRARSLDLGSVRGMAVGLALGGLLVTLPAIARVVPPPGAAAHGGSSVPDDHRQRLAKVRALLAKAESTEFVEEAEALSSKAQELISRYALTQLLDEPVAADGNAAPGVEARRIWIDAPYVAPKAMLISAVAGANRCTAVMAEQLGFSTIVGAPYDLEAVELLATSLLVQANRALLGHGNRAGSGGRLRTPAFRRSFLVSYAHRIGERLVAATEDAAQQTGRTRELVPVLREHEERVHALRDELFPRLVNRTTTVSDARGWALGRAAADQAQLDVRESVGARNGR